jgi:hypothetical protein
MMHRCRSLRQIARSIHETDQPGLVQGAKGLALPWLFGYFPPAVAKVIGREKKMREFIGFMIAYALYLGALWFFLQSADLSIRVIA